MKRLIYILIIFSLFGCVDEGDKTCITVMIGDSITARNDWGDGYANVGVGSSTTEMWREWVAESDYGSPCDIYILLGINDIALGFTEEETLTNYEQILIVLQRKYGAAIHVQSVFPTTRAGWNEGVESLNEKLEALCGEYGVEYIDVYPLLLCGDTVCPDYVVDRVHLSEAGYDVWCDAIN